MSLKLKTKAQSALEFLTTYGWALLVILIMVGVLAYFGILSPSKILPNRCNFGVEFQCVDYQISKSAGTFRLRLKNNAGEPVTITSMDLGTESTEQYVCGTAPANPTGWQSGNVTDLEWSSCTGGGLVSGDKGKVLVSIRYYPTSSSASYTKEVKGEVYSAVI